jgi:hypothetical protein
LLACTQGSLAVTTDDPKARDLSVTLVGRAGVLNLDVNCG